jgi:intein/homing endonuclease
MQIIKRDGRLVDFDINRIINAIEKAMIETLDGMNNNVSNAIANEIFNELRFKSCRHNVEQIQDMVEEKLMNSNRKDVAKKYILYRENRNKNRVVNNTYKLLDDDFISKYKHLPSPMKQLGEFVYYRTYSRWLRDEGRREYWWETVRRAVEFNCSLIPNVSKDEAQEFYDNMFNLKQFLSGRTMWVGMTDVSKEYGISNFNCAFVILDEFVKFKELFYALMIGTGVGFRILKSDVEKLPSIKTKLNLVHDTYNPVHKYRREDNTSIEFLKTVVQINIGDSKEGWVQALDIFFKILYENDYKKIDTIILNYNNVRSKGEKLKRFGGTASGHESLKNMFNKIYNVITKLNKETNNDYNRLRPIHCLDIANIIGENVVVGGVRRTSEVALIDLEDKECVESKAALYYQDEYGNWKENVSISHRKMSNNSIYYKEKPTREQLNWQIKQMRYSGEPGFMNVSAAKKRRSDFEGSNPCFTGDMRLLTVNGYKTFEELDGKEIDIINADGNISKSKVWYSGEKEVLSLHISNGDIITCTPEHIFMLKDGTSCEAKSLLNKELKTFDKYIKIVQKITYSLGKEKVYDFSEPLTNWGVVEGIVVHNCMEILLRDRGLCNLVTLVIPLFIKDGILDKGLLFKAQKLNARAALRMTCLKLELHKWDITQSEDRLLGCSITGWQDAMNELNYNTKQQKELLKELNKIANDTAKEYAIELNIPVPKLVCTIKPEGCCTIDHTRILDQGILFIDELLPMIEKTNGFTEISGITRDLNAVSKVYSNDIKNVIRINLKNGRKLDVTPSHLMSVNGSWVEAKYLNKNMIIDYKLNNYTNTKHSNLIDVTIDEFRSDAKNYKTPEKMNEDLAWLIGAYFANGSMTTNDRLKFHCQHYFVHEKVQKIWKEQFGVDTNIIKSKDRDSYTQDFKSVKITKWLKSNGLYKNESFNKIPLIIRISSKYDILSFIIGYSDNDGCYSNGSFSIDSSNEIFARHIQEIGEAVGICFGFSINKKRSNSFSKKPMFKLYMSRSYSLKEAIDYINTHSVKAQITPIVKSNIIKSKNPYSVISIEEIGKRKTYDIEVENEHWYYQGCLKSHNTLSQLPTVSCGIHFSHSPYYIRRIRINANDPLVKVCEELNYPVFPEVGQDIETCTTKVIEFPVKAPKGKTKYDVTAIEQLEIYKMFQENYTDHNTSITIHVRNNEWEEVEQWMWDNWESVVAVSFLSLDDSFYLLMPYESITEEEYNKRLKEMKPFIPSLISKYEKEEIETDIGNSECVNGICPVR